MNDYWSRKLHTTDVTTATEERVAPVDLPARTVSLSGTSLPPVTVYIAKDRPTGTAYLILVCLSLALAAFDDRDGTRFALVLSTVAVLCVGALVFWRAGAAAIRRVELHGDDDLHLVGNDGQRRLAIAELVGIDTEAGKLSQFLGWDELRLRLANNRVERIQRPDDPAELIWQIERVNPAIESRIRENRRPWIATMTAVLLMITSAVAAVGFAVSRPFEAPPLEVVFVVGIYGVYFLLASLLFRASHTAWIVLVILSIVNLGFIMLAVNVPAWWLEIALFWLLLLLAPGVRHWATD